MNKMAESFEEQWARVVAITQNCPFVTGRPVVHTSGSMSTVKEGFFVRYGVSFSCILLGLMTLVFVVYNITKESNDESPVLFFALLLGALFFLVGITRILTVRRICWNENAGCIYLHYGSLWNRHIFQIPRETIHIKMFVAGEKKWSSHFRHGDTILSLESKHRNSASQIHLLANSKRDLISHIAGQLFATHIDVEDSTLAREIVPDGRTICFPKTGLGRGGTQYPTLRLSGGGTQRRLITGRTPRLMAFWTAFITLGVVGIVVTVEFTWLDWEMGFVGIGSLFILAIGVTGWFSGFAPTIIVDSEKEDVIIHRGFLRSGFPKKIAFRHIVGVQVCPRHVEDEDVYTVFELNLVIHSDPDIERFNFMADGDNEKIMSYAQQIAAAMNKPVFDHSMIKKKTLADTIIL